MMTTSLATVKARLSAFVDSVDGTHERIVITRNGEPAAVLISPEDLESLEESIALLSDPEAMAEINEARRGIAKGDVVDVVGSSGGLSRGPLFERKPAVVIHRAATPNEDRPQSRQECEPEQAVRPTGHWGPRSAVRWHRAR